MTRKDITVPMPKELDEAVEAQLEYGDYKSEWIRTAIREKLEREGVDVTELSTDGGQLTLA